MFKIKFKNRVLILIILSTSLFAFHACKKEETKPIIVERFLSGVYPDSTITDGPFISDEGSQFLIRWIEKNSMVVEKPISGGDDGWFETKFGFPFNFIKSFKNELGSTNYSQQYQAVQKLAALSDIHGQYEICVDLLKNHAVIDENNNWIFGSGHLVINGDVFDRGSRVTEILWLLFKLEKQAEAAGGKVHYLLGNHEVMVLNDDLRYIDSKYLTTARKLGTTYDDLYSKNTIIGQWLRTKPVIVKINDMIFNHAGISSDFVSRNLNAAQVNQIFLEQIIDGNKYVIDADPLLDFLSGSNGPVWYRGYFEDNSLNFVKLNSILAYLNASYIVVGHTSMDKIKFYFDGKIIAIDSSIKDGMSGELLLYDNGIFTIGTLN